MLIVVQFPFADVRGFVPAPTHRLSAPAWPLAVPGKDFVRSFGGIEKRRRGGVEDWTAEDVYCRAAYPLRFYPPLRTIPFETASAAIELRSAFRRLLSDGEVTVRLEFGFRVAELNQNLVLDGQSALALVSYCLSRQVRVAARGSQPTARSCNFIDSPKQIATRYLNGTTGRTKESPVVPASWWVTPAPPLVLVEYSSDEIASLPRYARSLSSQMIEIDSEVFLDYCPVKYSGQSFGCWFLGYGVGANRDLLRRMRIHLLRLHAERECLKQVLRQLAEGKIRVETGTPESDALQLYLNNCTRLLMRKSRFGLPTSRILRVAQNADDIVATGERVNILSAIQKIRRNIYYNVQRFTASPIYPESVFYNITSNGDIHIGKIAYKGDEHVTEYNVSFGDHNVVQGDFVVASTIQNSFNRIDSSKVAPNLKESLKTLHQQIAEMTKQMDPVKAQEAARDLQSFTDEAVSASPRQKWYSVTADGLLAAAKAVGEVAAPIITTVKAILAILSGVA
jgi:hypothetical protein